MDQEIISQEQLSRITYNSVRQGKKIEMDSLFTDISAADYAILWLLSERMAMDISEKIYLKEAAKEMKLSLQEATKIARKLQNQGLVEWKHDGNGEEGTYLQITEKATNSLLRQRQKLSNYHNTVLEQFGRERFLTLISEMIALEEIMNATLTEETHDE